MSAEYLMKMEVLRRNREELTARRKEIERRIALREATAAEYSAIALQSCKQKWKSLRASAIAAKKRNDEFVREIHETQRKIDEVYVRTTQKLWPSDNQLELEKARYLRKVEELYPAWQEKVQAVRVQTLRELEEKKRAIEKRRYLAKKTFETEQTLDDLIQQTSHEIGLAENLEKNEAFEREVLRNQSALQAMRLDESIREHATGARLYMKQQALEQLSHTQQVQSDIEDKIFETFSPRGAIQAMRQANRSIAFVQPADNNAENSPERQRRSLSISVPTVKTRASVQDPLPDPYTNTQLPVNDTITNAREWSRTCLLPNSAGLRPDEPAKALGGRATARTDSPAPTTHLPHVELDEFKTPRKEIEQNQQIHTTSSFVPTCEQLPDLAVAFHKLSATAIIEPQEEKVAIVDTRKDNQNSTSAPANGLVEDESISAMRKGFLALATKTQSSRTTDDPCLERVHEPPVEATIESTRSPVELTHKDRIHAGDGAFADTRDVASSIPTTIWGDNPIEHAMPTTRPFQTYKLVEVDHQEATVSLSVDEKNALDNVTRESKTASPPELGVRSDDEAPTADLSLNLINSFESNQSSVMDFSVGKLLQTPAKFSDGINAHPPCQQPSPSNLRPPDVPTPTVRMGDISSSGIDVKETVTVPTISSVQIASIEKKPEMNYSVSIPVPNESRTSSFGARATVDGEGATILNHNIESSLVFSSLDSVSEIGSPATKHVDDTMLESMSDFGSPRAHDVSPGGSNEPHVPSESPPKSPMNEITPPAQVLPSLFTALSMPERLKALTALIARVEEGTNEGESIGTLSTDDTSHDTKRELIRMAASGRKAQINFFGCDVCFELVVDLAQELGPVLFPAKAFEGILCDQKMKKVHQNGKEKELDLWKAFSGHLKQLSTAKAIPVSTLVDMFTSAFLSHDPTNQRSQRKLRELLFSLCGATESPATRESTSSSPRREPQASEAAPPRGSMAAETPATPQIPSLLQTAFLQTTSPPNAKTYGIASSSFKKKSSTDDILKSMASSPTKLSQKLMRGGKMGDYSEFEEEDEVDLENLIGSKPSMGNSGSVAKSAASSRAMATSGTLTSRLGGVREDKDDFDVDF